MKHLFNLLFFIFPFFLSATLPPNAEDLRRVKTVINSPVLDQILSPDQEFISFKKGEAENLYILKTTGSTITIVLQYIPSEGEAIGPRNLQVDIFLQNPAVLEQKNYIFDESTLVKENPSSPYNQISFLKDLRAIFDYQRLYDEHLSEDLFSGIYNIDFTEKDIKDFALRETEMYLGLQGKSHYFMTTKESKREIFAFTFYSKGIEESKRGVLLYGFCH